MSNMSKPTRSDPATPMTVEEARSVYWLRNNYRPMGELLDEGYLTEERLTWAAKYAYDPRLKQAAAVLLNWMKQTSQPLPPQKVAKPPAAESVSTQAVNAGITIEQARATLWPFKPFKGQQMGILVDAGQITLKDLVYAIQTAWDERVKRAAVALATICLNQAVREPLPPAGPLKVISGGRSYSVRKQFQLTLIAGIVFGWISSLDKRSRPDGSSG